MVIDVVIGFAEGRGGLEQVLTIITQELTKKGHRVRVFQCCPPNYPKWADTIPEIYYYDIEGENYSGEIELFRYVLGYREYIDLLGMPDLILATHAPVMSLVSRLAVSHLADRRPPILSWLHGPPKYYGNAELLQYSDGHLAISEDVSNQIKEYVADAMVHEIKNPVKADDVKEVERPEDLLSLLYIGRLSNHQKRIDIMFNALQKLKGRWKLTLIGDGESRYYLEDLSKELGIASNLTWLGWQEQPWSKVEEASLLLLTSDFEGFGLVVVEALSRGIPVVSSQTEGPSEIIQNGVNGWLFPVGDIFQITNILQKIIDGEYSLPSKELCKKSVSKFSVQKFIDKFENVLLEYIDRKKG